MSGPDANAPTLDPCVRGAAPRVAEEIRVKHGRVVALLDEHDAHALRLRTLGMVAWATGGGDALVNWTGTPVAEVVIDRDCVRVLCTNIEVERLRREQLPDDIELLAYPWHEPRARRELLARLLVRRHLTDAEGAVRGLRAPLVPEEVERYAALGRDAAAAVTDAVLGLTVGVDEHSVAAKVASACLARAMQTPVLLVAGDERLERYRHPLPARAPIRRVGMVALVARRHGLLVSLSRMFVFGPVPSALAARHEVVLQVEAALWGATRPGTRLGDVLMAGIEAYAAAGFGSAWKEHHQGGPTGYLARDPMVLPGETRTVRWGEAFAWNPSLPGVKSEDTALLPWADAPNGTAPALRVLTMDPRWPTASVNGHARPAPMIL